MLRLVALLLVTLLGRSAAEGGFARAMTAADASWQQVASSPASLSHGMSDGRGSITSLVPTGVLPSGVSPNDRAPTQSIGAALHERSGHGRALPSRLEESARAAVTSGAGRVAFPYDATAPPLHG